MFSESRSAEEPTHAIWLEPRRGHFARRVGAAVLHREVPLAHCSLRRSAVADRLLSGSEWLTYEDEDQIHVLGEGALELAAALCGACPPLHPLEVGLRDVPARHWEVAGHLVEKLLEPLPERGERLRALVPCSCPQGSNLWLRVLPEALLGDRLPQIQAVSVVTPLLGEEVPGVEWCWVVGERGVSLAARHAGATREAFLPAFEPDEDDDPSGGAESEGVLDEAARTARRCALLEQLVERSIELHATAWAGVVRPALRVRLAVPVAAVRSYRAVLAEALGRFGIEREFATEVLGFNELLRRALGRPRDPRRATQAAPPRAVRPRVRGVSRPAPRS